MDAIQERVAGERIVGTKTFAPGPPLAPRWPWVPEGLVLEALTQVSGLVLVPEDPTGAEGPRGGFLAAASKVAFSRPVEPGEALTLRSRLDLRLGSAARFQVEAAVGDARVAEGVITLGGIQSA